MHVFSKTFMHYRILVALLAGSACSLQNMAPAMAARQDLQLLATVSNTKNRDASRMSLILAGNEVVGVRFETDRHDARPARVDILDFKLNELAQEPGAVVVKEGGKEGDKYDVVFVVARVSSKKGFGALNIRYMTNALFGSYHSCPAKLVRDKTNKWILLNVRSQTIVNHIEMEVGSMGIKRIRGLCD
jgi:hypothetical protein